MCFDDPRYNRLFFANRKRTQHTTEELWPHLFPGLPVPDWWLHYVGVDRRKVCRCSRPARHPEKTFRLIKEWPELEASVKFYMDRMNYKAFNIGEYLDYQLKREKLWQSAGVYIRSFHWADAARIFVCRCAERTCYKYGMPKNIVQLEQCAEYFLLHRDKIIVSQDKWERYNEDSPPPYAPKAQPESKYSRQQYQLLNKHENTRKVSQTVPKSEMGMRGSAEPLTSRFVEPRKDGAAIQQELEMPPQVWQNGRPSLWKHSDGISSSASTPLGSSFFPPSEEPRVPATAPLENRPAPWNRSDSSYLSTTQYQGQKGASVGGMHSRSKSYEAGHARMDSGFDMRSMHSGLETIQIKVVKEEIAELSPEAYYLGDRRAIPAGHDNQNKGSNGHVSEIPVEGVSAELPTVAPRQQHTPTLNALEGRDWGAIPEMEAKTTDSNDKGEEVPVRMSCHTYDSGLVDSLLEQVSYLGSSTTLDQDVQLRHPTDSSLRDSGFGSNSGHSEEPSPTLRSVFQYNLTLAERIKQDRKAIFGTQRTPLKEEIVIEFPHRSDAFKCSSEEDLAVTQLALIKDHVGINAKEVFSRWNADDAAPNWNADVIRPAVQLFMGWNRSFRTLFSMSQEAFLRVVAWGELVRLMNQSWTIMKCQPGEKVMFSQLGQVHRQFFKSKATYDREKKDWKISRFEALGCDMITAYLVTMTIEIGRST
ncbi:hypothetical protein COCMIDRAFT_40348 [Bipolaris oryzae ATCC 44560]|uniref:Uncharacterized protein n=1 Tax=Bipolaris oryzae ATCC 44560 TaxID=930090 RepID=W6YQ25_COCMI|nr:uncharacterized protein COCMIDRAFT_40348 [Bipolaris oryzae ATCC 44560]EUC41492.1 hypothetical protein COCMIDRAFT_40348 [Bipolaris oryzae ATCC 44560]